jgi:hypothetical protein
MLDDLVRWLPALEPVTRTMPVPLWAIVAAGTALIGSICLFAFTRSGREGSIGVVARVVAIAIVASMTWIARDIYGPDSQAERRALEARLGELAARALTPGSALACLDATAGETVEASCEKALFATPEATAAATSYVAAQLAVLADANEFGHGLGLDLPALTNLRHALELDRFGLAARVLAVRDGCTPQNCAALALLHEPSRVKTNLGTGAFDLYVIRHLANWPAVPGSPSTAGATASAVPARPENPAVQAAPEPPRLASAPAAAPPGTGQRMPLAKLFFPSSESIPAINIMAAEPGAPSNASGTDQAAKTPTPPRKPAAGSPPPARTAPAPRRAPAGLNAAAQPAPGAGAPLAPTP